MGKIKRIIQIDKDKCVECGKCEEICSKVKLPKLCSGCGKCVKVCPFEAITLVERNNDDKTYKTINNKIQKTMKKKGLTHVFIVLVVIAGFGTAVMLLWNALLPDIFGITSINFWQALGLFALSHILFSGMGTGMIKHSHRHHHNSINDKWMKMTPEQREKFIDKRKHFGFERPFDKYRFDRNEHEEAGKGND